MPAMVDVFNPIIQQLVDDLQNDDATMLEIANLFAKMCDPYVPFLEGPLSQSGLAQVQPGLVTYGNDAVPYAHYQYVGVNFNHTLDYHPRATAYWDKVMMQEKGDEFNKQAEQILVRRAKEIYGS